MEYAKQMKEEIKEAIERVFGEIDDCGCYRYNGAWLSTESILEIVFETIDYNDYMFMED